MAEQRYQAVLAVIGDGETVTDVAARFGVTRKTIHAWLVKYEAGGVENLKDGSHRPRSCPHQIGSLVEVEIARMRTTHPSWGPRRLVYELAKLDITVSESAVYRALVRLNLIDPTGRRLRDRKWKRWERGTPMELWQMDTVGGFVLADGTRAKVLSGVDDHSRFCVSAHLMVRETSRNVCEGLAKALRAHGVPVQILTDNGKVFTGRFNRPPVEVLFDTGMSGERDRASADPATIADDHGQDRTLPPGDPHRVPHRSGLRVPGRSPGRARRVDR